MVLLKFFFGGGGLTSKKLNVPLPVALLLLFAIPSLLPAPAVAVLFAEISFEAENVEVDEVLGCIGGRGTILLLLFRAEVLLTGSGGSAPEDEDCASLPVVGDDLILLLLTLFVGNRPLLAVVGVLWLLPPPDENEVVDIILGSRGVLGRIGRAISARASRRTFATRVFEESMEIM